MIVIIFVISSQVEKKRTEALLTMSSEMGMTFKAKDSSKEAKALVSSFGLGNKGHSQSCKNIMKGEAGGLQTTILDHFYKIGSGKDAQRYHQSVLIFEQPDLPMPSFQLRPENLGDKIKSVFGRKDIDFDDSPEFSKQYYLVGANEKEVRNLFSPRLRSFLVRNQGWYLEANGNYLLLFRAGHRVKPPQMTAFLQEGLTLKNALADQLTPTSS